MHEIIPNVDARDICQLAFLERCATYNQYNSNVIYESNITITDDNAKVTEDSLSK